MIFVESISYIKSKLRQINENSYQTKIEFVDVVIDERNLLCYKCIDSVIRENDCNSFGCFYHVTNFAYYLYQVDYFELNKSIANFNFVKYAIQKQNKFDIVTFRIA